jgi:hypothetical protein
MELKFEFNEQADRWFAEFTANADFNLHIEGVVGGDISVFQRGSATGEYAYVREATQRPSFGKVYDCDFSALVYPKYIRVSCPNVPTMSVVNFAQ